jgi:hypothetical protein
MKICTKCKAEKPNEEFSIDRSRMSGLKSSCKDCDAAAKKKKYYATSPKARSNRVVQQRHRRWRDIAEVHGERWLIEQVQTLKRSGRLTGDASSKAFQDDRLAAFFREANRASVDILRTHLGSRLWDRVASPFVPKKERKAVAEERKQQLQARLFATDLTSLEWDQREARYVGVDSSDEGQSFAEYMEKEESDRVLRKGRFASKRPDGD